MNFTEMDEKSTFSFWSVSVPENKYQWIKTRKKCELKCCKNQNVPILKIIKEM